MPHEPSHVVTGETALVQQTLGTTTDPVATERSQRIRQQIADRASRFTSETVRSAPITVARLIVSGIPTPKLRALDKGLRAAQTFVEQRESFAALPAGLATVRTAVLTRLTGEERTAALALLDGIQRLPLEVQNAAALHLRRLATGEFAPGGVVPPSPRAALVPAGPVLASWNRAALLAILSHYDVDPRGLDAVLRLMQDGFGLHDPVASWIDTLRERPAAAAGEALAAPFRVVGAIGGTVLRAAPGGELVAGAAGAVARNLEFAFAEALKPVQGVFGLPFSVPMALTGTGRRPGETGLQQFRRYFWPEVGERYPWTQIAADYGAALTGRRASENWLDFADLAGTLLVGEGVFRSAAAIRQARRTPAEFAATEVPGKLTEWVVELVEKPVDEWIRTRRGQRLLDEIEKTTRAHPDAPEGALQQRFRGMDPQLAKTLARGTREERARGLVDYVKNAPDPEQLRLLIDRRRAVQEEIASLGEAPLDTPRLQSLIAERMRLDREIGNAVYKTPVWEWPRASTIRAVVRDAPATPIERLLAAVHRRGRLHLERFVDDLPRHSELWLPDDPRKPADWAARNASTLQNFLQRAGTPSSTIRRVLEEMTEIRTKADSFRWMQHIGDAIAEGVTGGRFPTRVQARSALLRGERIPGIDLRLLDDVTFFFRNTDESVMRAPYHPNPDDPHTVRNVLEDENGRPVPSQSTEFIGRIPLPDIERVIDATSLIRRASRTKAGKALLVPYAFAKSALGLSTAILKPLVLAPRVVAMSLRIQLEQFFRNIAFGYRGLIFRDGLLPGGIPVPGFVRKAGRALIPEEIRDYILARYRRIAGERLVQDDLSELGLIWSEAFDPNFKVEYVTRTLTAERAGNRTMTPSEVRENFTAIYERIQEFNRAPEVRYLVRHGPEETLRWLETDPYMSFWWENQMRPHLERIGVEPLEWLRRKQAEVRELTGGIPELERAVATGKWYTDADALRQGEAFRLQEVARLRLELEEVRTTLRDAADQPAAIRRELEIRESRLSRDLARAERTEATGPYISLDNRGAFVAELIARYGDGLGDYVLPPSVRVPRRTTALFRPTGIEGLNNGAAALSNWLYGSLRWASRMDVRGTRGSLYHQVYTRSLASLERAGWTGQRAELAARARAAMVTKDIMYDLSARTSVQRAFKDTFWFAPAVQEVAYTWLVKIPSRAYWPLGMGYLANRVKLLLDLGREAGLIQRDARGEEVIVVPIGGLLSKIPGVEVPDIVFGRPEGLNLALQGLPGLAPLQGAGLAKLSRSYGGVFKALSDVFLPFGEDVVWAPAALNHTWELVTGEPPPWERFSPEFMRIQHDRTRDQALQAAISELAEQGIHPPKPEDFLTDRTDPLTGRPVVDSAAYRAARDAYWDRVWGLQEEYFHGMKLVRLLGASVAPLSLYSTTEEEQFWERFWRASQVPPDMREEQRRWIDEWLAEHPNSLAYSLSYYATGEQRRELPYTASGEDEFYAKLYEGAVRLLPPEEYLRKYQTWESHRYYVAQLNSCLGQVGASTSALLRNWGAYKECTRAYRDSWDRYLFLNPEAEADLREGRRLWAERFGIPERTYESERIAELSRLLDFAAPYFLDGGGIEFDGDYRSVRSAIGELYSETGTFGPPNTERERILNWYFDEVIGPYMDKLGPLYEKARDLQARGLEDQAARVYDRIRRLRDQQRPATGPDGKRYPTPERFFWGSMNEEQQERARLSWATKPISWLSTFQLRRVGYRFGGSPAEVREFLEGVTRINDLYYEAIARESPTPEERARFNVLRERFIREGLPALGIKGARDYGPWAMRVAALELGPPILRLDAIGFGEGNETWRLMVAAARQVYNRIAAKGYSPQSYSQFAFALKSYLHSAIERFRDPASPDYDPRFARLWEQVREAVPDGDNYREGVLLYEAVLFGQFNSDAFGIDELVKAVESAP